MIVSFPTEQDNGFKPYVSAQRGSHKHLNHYQQPNTQSLEVWRRHCPARLSGGSRGVHVSEGGDRMEGSRGRGKREGQGGRAGAEIEQQGRGSETRAQRYCRHGCPATHPHRKVGRIRMREHSSAGPAWFRTLLSSPPPAPPSHPRLAALKGDERERGERSRPLTAPASGSAGRLCTGACGGT